jgi:phenylacetate-CoA ligase
VAYQVQRELAARESWSRGEIENFQLSRINEIWSHAIRHVPYYRQLFEENKLPNTFQNLEQYRSSVPILSKHAIRQNPKLFLSDHCAPGKWYYTSGSTGTPTPVYRSKQAHLELLQCKYRFYSIWGVDIFDPTAVI